MRNKLIKGAHLSERKCREILQLFCEDLTATQIANISGVSRVTVNNYLKLIRIHIAKFCEEHNPSNRDKGYFFYLPVTNKHKPVNPESGEPADFRVYYGFYKMGGKIFVDWLESLSKPVLQNFQKARHNNGSGNGFANMNASGNGNGNVIGSGSLNGNGSAGASLPASLSRYYAIADVSDWRLYRIDAPEGSPTRLQLDDISGFWGHTKNRLLKFRGLNKNTIYLHIKECEFRYNYRNEDILSIILGIINRAPLHPAKW